MSMTCSTIRAIPIRLVCSAPFPMSTRRRAAPRFRHRRVPRGIPAIAGTPPRPLDLLLARRSSARRRAMTPLIEVRDLKKHFPVYKGVFSRVSGHVRAVDGVSFHIARGETPGLVGESGCGKSTVGSTLLKLLEPTEGKILVNGEDITGLDAAQMLPYRRQMQMIYQDPYASLNPRMSAGEIVGEPLIIHRAANPKERRERVLHLFERVGLRPELADSYPHEFSGGQRQRIAIARSLALRPGLIVSDEPVSALDVSIQAQII